MNYQIRTEGQYTVIALRGDVDLHHSPKAREQILKYLGDQCHVMVDLADVAYIDSSGIASLIEGFQLAKQHKLQFGLVGVSEPAMQVLKLARLDRVLPIHQTISGMALVSIR